MREFNRSFYSAVGSKIKQQRLERKITREQLARLADISDKFLYDIEVGNKGMSADTLYRIGIALGVSIDWLLGVRND